MPGVAGSLPFADQSFDTSRLEADFWLARDYLPEHAQLSAGRPALPERASAIGARLEPVPIPWDCCDGNFPSYWRRPEAYLDGLMFRLCSVRCRLGSDAGWPTCCVTWDTRKQLTRRCASYPMWLISRRPGTGASGTAFPVTY